jgi:hypothetical protein
MTVVNGGKLLIFKPTLLRVIGWTCILFFLFGATGAWRAGAAKAALVFLFFIGLGAYIVLFSGTLEMNSETIIYRTPLARYQIRWDEVTRIELDRAGSNIVFWGENKSLAALGPYLWQGADRTDMLLLVAAQIDKLGINVQQSEKAGFRMSKNTKVRIDR